MEPSTRTRLQPEDLIPEKQEGVHKEIHEEVIAPDEPAAAATFMQACRRLRDVNHWAEIAVGASSEFRLCDAQGALLQRPAEEGDLVRISLPGAKRPDGTYDWVQLPQVREGIDPEGCPWILLTTRPIADPTVPSDDTAHFFDDGSTGTFIIRRKGPRIEGNHYGRNERPNPEGGLLEKARALMVTIGAYLGMSDVQWRHLIKGLLGKE